MVGLGQVLICAGLWVLGNRACMWVNKVALGKWGQWSFDRNRRMARLFERLTPASIGLVIAGAMVLLLAHLT